MRAIRLPALGASGRSPSVRPWRYRLAEIDTTHSWRNMDTRPDWGAAARPRPGRPTIGSPRSGLQGRSLVYVRFLKEIRGSGGPRGEMALLRGPHRAALLRLHHLD